MSLIFLYVEYKIYFFLFYRIYIVKFQLNIGDNSLIIITNYAVETLNI